MSKRYDPHFEQEAINLALNSGQTYGHVSEALSSSYYGYLKRSNSQRMLFNQVLNKKLNELLSSHHSLYGDMRLHACLLDEGYCLSRECILKTMPQLNLKTKQRKKYKKTTDSTRNKPVAESFFPALKTQ